MEATLERPVIESPPEPFAEEYEPSVPPVTACQIGTLACDSCENIGCSLLALRGDVANNQSDPMSDTESGVQFENGPQTTRDMLFDDSVDIVVAKPEQTNPVRATADEPPKQPRIEADEPTTQQTLEKLQPAKETTQMVQQPKQQAPTQPEPTKQPERPQPRELPQQPQSAIKPDAEPGATVGDYEQPSAKPKPIGATPRDPERQPVQPSIQSEAQQEIATKESGVTVQPTPSAKIDKDSEPTAPLVQSNSRQPDQLTPEPLFADEPASTLQTLPPPTTALTDSKEPPTVDELPERVKIAEAPLNQTSEEVSVETEHEPSERHGTEMVFQQFENMTEGTIDDNYRETQLSSVQSTAIEPLQEIAPTEGPESDVFVMPTIEETEGMPPELDCDEAIEDFYSPVDNPDTDSPVEQPEILDIDEVNEQVYAEPEQLTSETYLGPIIEPEEPDIIIDEVSELADEIEEVQIDALSEATIEHSATIEPIEAAGIDEEVLPDETTINHKRNTSDNIVVDLTTSEFRPDTHAETPEIGDKSLADQASDEPEIVEEFLEQPEITELAETTSDEFSVEHLLDLEQPRASSATVSISDVMYRSLGQRACNLA